MRNEMSTNGRSAHNTKDGYHIAIGFLLNGTGDLVSTPLPTFAEHTDKLIFWTELARSAEANF